MTVAEARYVLAHRERYNAETVELALQVLDRYRAP